MGAPGEPGWSPREPRDYSSFAKRWQETRKILDIAGANRASDKLARENLLLRSRDIFIWKTADQYGEVRRNKK